MGERDEGAVQGNEKHSITLCSGATAQMRPNHLRKLVR